MDPSETGLMPLGERVQRALEAETQPAEQLAVGRVRWLRHVTERGDGERRRAARRLRHVGFAAAAVLAIAMVAVRSWSAPISFVTGAHEGSVGDIVEANEREPLRVQFSEGSLMMLHARASVRVLETRASGARVLLESGMADVSIAHRQGRATRWRFEAGPFQVLVKGTKFELGWEPATQALTLNMKSGSVELSGSCLPTPRLVERGASLRLSCARAEPPPQAVQSAAAEPPATATATAPPLEQPAEPQGFAASCETADKAELVAWAKRDRLAGRVARARTALLALRRRFPGSKESGTAAFTLGRMAFDQTANYAEAAHWFAVYLAEQPRGPLMGDAAGRLLEAHDRLGDRAAARRQAQAYLRRFPDGPYASQARRILAQ